MLFRETRSLKDPYDYPFRDNRKVSLKDPYDYPFNVSHIVHNKLEQCEQLYIYSLIFSEAV